MQEARRAGFVLLAQLRLTQRAGLGEPAPSFHSQISVGRCRNIVLAAPGPALSRDFSFAAVQLFCWDWMCSLAQGRCLNLRTLSKSILFAAHGGARGGGEGRCRSVTQAKPKPTSHALLFTVLGKSYSSVETAASPALLSVQHISHLGRLRGTPSSTEQCFSMQGSPVCMCMCVLGCSS